MNLTRLIVVFGIALLSLGQAPIHYERKKIEKIHESASSYIKTKNYVHTWEPFPQIEGTWVKNGEKITIQPLLGQVEVIFIIASWCIPCQELIDPFLKLEAKYSQGNVRFTYLFSHDIKNDVLGFLNAYRIPNGIIASQQVLRDFHNPPLPTVYLSDRKGWLINRFERFNVEKISELDTKLRYLTVF